MKKSDELYLEDKLSFWEHLTNAEQNQFLSNISIVQYAKGEAVYGKEKDCLGVLIVKSGELRTYILSEDGREITLYRMNEGDVCILSASCLLKSITFEACIEADEDSEVFLIDLVTFSRLQENNIYVENFALNVAVEKFSEVMWTMEQILFMRFDKRLALFLLDEVAKTSSQDIRLTHEQIAKYIGSAREVVSRMMKRFEADGMVRLYHGGAEIVNTRKLKALT